jgi:hypothetical protein
MSDPDRPLSPDEQRVFDAMAAVDDEWSVKPRSAERAGAKAAIGAIWSRLGWLTRGVNESHRRALARMRDKR